MIISIIFLFSQTCRVEEINGVSYFIAGRKVLNIDKTVICRDMSNLFGFQISQKRLEAIKPFYIAFGDLEAWVNQCLCWKCCNCDYAMIFLNKLGNKAEDALLRIIDLNGLIRLVCCENTDNRVCLSILSGQKCFLHGHSKKSDCAGNLTNIQLYFIIYSL